MKPGILINGFGTIGKRVAHAVSLQSDMSLVGVSNRSVNINVRNMLGDHGPLKGTPLYCSVNDKDKIKSMEGSGYNYKGSMEALLKSGKVDIVVDATPAGVEEENKKIYDKYGVKQIYQGGAEADIAQVSFSALGNYGQSFGKKSVRVVSCNTTSLVRTISAVNKAFGINDVFAVLIRRAGDPWEIDEGPLNSIVPVAQIPSHHGPDVQTVLPNIKITTTACKVPTTLAHTHFVTAKLKKKADRNGILKALARSPRILLFKSKEGYESTSQIMEYFRDVGRPRNDMYEVCVWNETVNVVGKIVYWSHAVHSEAIVIPENIDAIRAMTGIEKNALKSIKKTDNSLGVF
jgi:glyceraldehyde-3-phosphate dehydrogenase (NAD(P))